MLLCLIKLTKCLEFLSYSLNNYKISEYSIYNFSPIPNFFLTNKIKKSIKYIVRFYAYSLESIKQNLGGK